MWNPSKCLRKQTWPFPPKQTGPLRATHRFALWMGTEPAVNPLKMLIASSPLTELLHYSCKTPLNVQQSGSARAAVPAAALYGPQWRSLCYITSFDSPACAARTMTHNRQWLLFNQRHAYSLPGVWFQCLKSWGRAETTWRKCCVSHNRLNLTCSRAQKEVRAAGCGLHVDDGRRREEGEAQVSVTA